MNNKRLKVLYFYGLVIFLMSLSNYTQAAEKIPEKYFGKWLITLEPQAGFPWWLEIKIPTELTIGESGCTFKDQNGHICTIETLFYDSEDDIIVFRHCAKPKAPGAFDVLQIASVKNGELRGSVKTYKTLFRWVGVKENSRERSTE